MPSFELVLAIRKLAKPELTAALKRAANFILDKNGVLRKIENLGLQQLHYKVSNPIPNTRRFTEAHFFVYHLDVSPDTVRKIREECHHDIDLIKTFFVLKEDPIPADYECTLDDEFKPPALRQSVQSLIAEGRKEHEVYDVGDPNTNPHQIV